MSSTITAGNATNGLALSCDNTGILELKTGTGSGTTAITADASQNVTVAGTLTAPSVIPSSSTAPTNGVFLPAANTLGFSTASTERARIDSSGNLLVNTTTRTGGERMALWYSSNSGPGLNIRDTSAQNGNTFIQFNNGATTGGAITSNGTTTMTYGSASDYRLKENLAPLTGALAKVAALQPKVGSWKVDGSDFIGFVAHELQDVFPDAVVGEKDKVDEEGNPQYQMVDTGAASIIATLTAAIQEQQQMIETLQAKVAALEAK